MAASSHDLDALVKAIRACFGLLRALGEDLHSHFGVTAAMRAVLEFIDENPAATVPEIARAKLVSRQNIQARVDALGAAGLVVMRDNPAHKRSQVIAATATGRKVFAEMRRRERAALKKASTAIAPDAMKTTLAALAAFREQLLKLAIEETHERTE